MPCMCHRSIPNDNILMIWKIQWNGWGEKKLMMPVINMISSHMMALSVTFQLNTSDLRMLVPRELRIIIMHGVVNIH